jgi:ABC-type bacteriocin/lantibiotic exporter with double-glycine peptidase domain
LKRQARSYWCGVASIANALEVLGIARSQREIQRLCHVSPEAGTDEVEMKRALLANGCDVDEWHDEYFDDNSVWWVRDSVTAGNPVILCVDQSEHWVTVIGICGDRFVLFDPSRNAGIEVHSADTLAERWADDEDGYYGLAISVRKHDDNESTARDHRDAGDREDDPRQGSR